MKTKIFKIIIALAVSLVLSASVSLANDKKGKQHKQHGNAYGYQKNQKGQGHHPSWKKKRLKSYHHRHRSHDHYHRHYYQKKGHGYHPSWKKRHYKSYHHRQRPKQRYHKRYDHYELHDNHHRRYKRPPHRDGFFFGMSFNDPYMAVVIGAKGN